MSQEQNITIKYKYLAGKSSFIVAFNSVAANCFGGRQDQALLGLSKRIAQGAEDYQELRSKIFKQYGKPSRKAGGNFTLDSSTDEEFFAASTALDELAEQEVDLKIKTPVKVTKRKSHRFSPLDSALVEKIIEVEYDQNDDGAYLDKMEK